MQVRYLLDTNICIYIRQKRSLEVLRYFERLRPGEAAISAITYGELLYGAEKSAHRSAAIARLRELADILLPLPLPAAASECYGTLRARLESRGEMIGNNDLWIAAHALAEHFILVTNNERGFRRVNGLKLENWAG